MTEPNKTQTINLDTIHEYEIINDVLVNKTTGEVIDSISEINAYIKIINRFTDIKNKVIACNRTEKFTKLIHVNAENLPKMSLQEKGFLLFTCQNLKKYDNSLYLNSSDYISNSDIAKQLSISESTLKRIMKSLNNKQLIKTIGRGRNRKIYINPIIAINGNGTRLKTLQLFSNSNL